MSYLLIVSLVWAFSFGLIKGRLAGLDSNFVSLARMALALAVFLPFLRIKKVSFTQAVKLVLTGTVQFGIMYAAYICSFRYLQAYEVALFTIFTPLYVSIINDLSEKRFHSMYLLCALLAVTGTAIISWNGIKTSDIISGFLYVQLSNIAFAAGQIAYRNTMKGQPDTRDHHVFALLYLGGCIITGILSAITTDYSSMVLSKQQVLTLLYLGILASGICFFMWNRGARLVNAGTLAVFNNLKIPLAVAVSIIFFGEKGNIIRLVTGGSIIAFSLVLSAGYSKKTGNVRDISPEVPDNKAG